MDNKPPWVDSQPYFLLRRLPNPPFHTAAASNPNAEPMNSSGWERTFRRNPGGREFVRFIMSVVVIR